MYDQFIFTGLTLDTVCNDRFNRTSPLFKFDKMCIDKNIKFITIIIKLLTNNLSQGLEYLII